MVETRNSKRLFAVTQILIFNQQEQLIYCRSIMKMNAAEDLLLSSLKADCSKVTLNIFLLNTNHHSNNYKTLTVISGVDRLTSLYVGISQAVDIPSTSPNKK